MGMKRIQPSDDFDAQESCIWNRKSVETWISSRSWGTAVIAALTFWHMSCAVRGPRADTHVENLYCRKSAPLPTGRGGKLIPPWTVELATAGEKARADLHGRELIVDLRSLTAIGAQGESVLLQLMSERVKLRCGVFTKEVLRRLASTSR